LVGFASFSGVFSFSVSFNLFFFSFANFISWSQHSYG
jgi:hypothetical protein